MRQLCSEALIRQSTLVVAGDEATSAAGNALAKAVNAKPSRSTPSRRYRCSPNPSPSLPTAVRPDILILCNCIESSVMAENAPPADPAANANSEATRGLPYYEKLRKDLRDALQKKRLLDNALVGAISTQLDPVANALHPEQPRRDNLPRGNELPRGNHGRKHRQGIRQLHQGSSSRNNGQHWWCKCCAEKGSHQRSRSNIQSELTQLHGKRKFAITISWSRLAGTFGLVAIHGRSLR